MIRSSLYHFRLATVNLQAMVGWYARVFGMVPNHQSGANVREQTVSGLMAAWGTNDNANHCITLLSISGLTAQRQQSCRQQPQHVTFECATLDDLLAAYVRLKGLGIEPVVTVIRGAMAAFYYDDPDHNSVEMTVDNFGNLKKSNEYMRSPPDSAREPKGTYVDPEKMIAARAAGMSIAELHKRAHAGELAAS